MTKIDAGEFNRRSPKITRDMLEQDVAILTIVNAAVVTVNEGTDTERKSIILSFEETGEHVFWPTATEVGILIEKFGDDTDDWQGEKMPLEKVSREFGGKTHDKLGIPAAEQWDDYLKPKKSSVKAAPVKGKKK